MRERNRRAREYSQRCWERRWNRRLWILNALMILLIIGILLWALTLPEAQEPEDIPPPLPAAVQAAVLSAANSGLYVCSRMVWSLAQEGMIPRVLAKTNFHGVPVCAVMFSMAGSLLALLSSVVAASTVYLALVAVSGLASLVVWASGGVCHLRFRHQWLAQGHTVGELKYRAPGYPFVPIAAIVMCVGAQVLVICAPSQRSTLLTEIPAGLFETNTKAQTFLSVFGHTAIRSVPATLYQNCQNVTVMTSLFDSCKALEIVPADLFGGCPAVTSFSQVFRMCTALKSIPELIFFNNTLVTTFKGAFSGAGIETIPAGLFARQVGETSCSAVFQDCPIGSIPRGLFSTMTKCTDFSQAC